MVSPLRAIVSKAKKALVDAPEPKPRFAPLLPRDEPPVLGHRPGIDRTIYAPDAASEMEPPFGSERAADYTVMAEGQPRKCFFIIGHPRSGTHWLGHVVNQHPAITSFGEYRFEALRTGFDDLVRHDWHACHVEPMRSAAERAFRDSIRGILASSCVRKPEAVWLGDRTPRSLQVYLDWAPTFMIIRDPRDILVSWAHTELTNAGPDYTTGDFARDLEPLRQEFLKDKDFFKNNPHLLLGHERWAILLASKWRKHTHDDLTALKGVLAGTVRSRVYAVRYEALHADVEGERAKMYRFLGVDPAQAGPLSEQTRSKPGFSQENPYDIYRAGKVGEWRKYFTPDVKRWFKHAAGDALIEMGYEKDHSW